MKNQFKVGVNFEEKLLNNIIELNKEQTENFVTELYGSIACDHQLAARPAFRLPQISDEELKKYITKARNKGIVFNYTLNSISPYVSKKEFANNLDKIINRINYLKDIGVYRFTISNPILLEIFKKYIDRNTRIEISTISHVDTLTQIKFYNDEYCVDKICCNLLKNRDFNWLEKASNYCYNNNIILELMVNEFCGVGGNNYGTHCIYRDSCYICHATNVNESDALSFDNYPMKFCTQSRNKNPANWLRMNWIRPDDLHYYNDIGIYNFKITGRTGSSNYIIKTLNAYLNEHYEGNLINLWKPLESITGKEKDDFALYNIQSDKLNGFIENWVTNKHNCANEVCGETCDYCERFYKECIEGKE